MVGISQKWRKLSLTGSSMQRSLRKAVWISFLFKAFLIFLGRCEKQVVGNRFLGVFTRGS